MNSIFTKSEKFREEYCCSIVKIGELTPIEGSDFLAKTVVDGFTIVVRKDECQEGDIMFYCENESELNHNFLSVNNLFELKERKLNLNYKEVESLMNEGNENEAKTKVGFFNKHGRVKMIRLRGVASMGFLFKLDTMMKWCSKVKNVNLDELVGTNFDTVDGKLFIKAYVPNISVATSGTGRSKNKKRDKRLTQFDRIVKGQFAYHYDTLQLNKNIAKIAPTDVVTITNKIHGTSFIDGNILTKCPIYVDAITRYMTRNKYKRIKTLKKSNVTRYHEKSKIAREITSIMESIKPTYSLKYDCVYSSRQVIKNQYINKKVTSGFYGYDIWGEYAKMLNGFIPKDMTVYGEIFGYNTGDNTGIQSLGGKVYDYGCEVGTNKLMIYRIRTRKEDGTYNEWDVKDVHKWTIDLMKKNEILASHIHPIDILYHGTLMDLYPEIDINNHWHENVLETMKNDVEHFGMEKDEPMCNNKLPREGVVIRIDGDDEVQAFKLKSLVFLGKEAKDIDDGKVDNEMEESYGE